MNRRALPLMMGLLLIQIGCGLLDPNALVALQSASIGAQQTPDPTGWELTGDDLQQAGERIANLRMAFEVREGNNPRARYVPGRLWGGESTA